MMRQVHSRRHRLAPLVASLILVLWAIACTVSPTPMSTQVANATLMIGKLVDKGQASRGDVLQYTLVVVNDQLRGGDPGTSVQIVDRLPEALELVTDSLPADATYDTRAHAIYWDGQVPRGSSVDVVFQARLTASTVGMPSIVNTLVVTDAFGRERTTSAETRVVQLPNTATPRKSTGEKLPSGVAPTPSPSVSPLGATATMTPRIEPHDIELVGYLGSSPAEALAVQCNRAYVGLGNELSVIDVSNPNAMARMGYTVLNGPVLDIAAMGDHLYAAMGEGAGLVIIDASDDTKLSVLGTLYEGLSLSSVTISEGYAYVSTGSLHILDLSNPALPAEVSMYRHPASLTTVEGKEVSVQGGYAYSIFRDMANNATGFRVVDVSDPTAPSAVATYQADARVQALTVDGGQAYLLVGEDHPRLVVVDVSDPAKPSELSFKSIGVWTGTNLAVADGRAYLVDHGSSEGLASLQVLDMSDPDDPVALARCDLAAPDVRSVAVLDGLLFITTGDGLIAVDVIDPSATAMRGFYLFERVSRTGRDVAVEGRYAYIAAGWDGLQVVDLSDAANPRVVSRFDTSGHAWAVALQDGLAYIADENCGLRVIDVHDPLQPLEIGSYDVPGPYDFFHGVAVDGSYAYVAEGQELGTGLRIVDVAEPASPTEVAFVPLTLPRDGALSPRVEDVAVRDGYAYLAAGTAGLRVVDVADPTRPVEVGYYDTPGRADNLAHSGRFVYLADGDLRILDVSDPAAVTEVGFYDLLGSAQAPSVAVVGSLAVVTSRGLAVLDVSDPSLPREVAAHMLPHGRVAMDGREICVVNGGLFVLRLSFALR